MAKRGRVEMPCFLPVLSPIPVQPRCLQFPIRDQWVPSVGYMGIILDAIDDALAANLPVFVHCRGGVGRTGTVVACWPLRHGLAARHTMARVLMRLRNAELNRHSGPHAAFFIGSPSRLTVRSKLRSPS